MVRQRRFIVQYIERDIDKGEENDNIEEDNIKEEEEEKEEQLTFISTWCTIISKEPLLRA
jgi:hypothetical protein